jgi:hypothetical protein
LASNGSTVPVIVGLALGIGFIVIFAAVANASFVSSSPLHYIGRYPHMTLTIEGIKETYSKGETIDFTLNVKGYGTNCVETPNIRIRDSAGDVVWIYETVNLMGGGDPDCNHPHEINDVWNSKERLSALPPEANIHQPSISQAGKYTLEVIQYGEKLDHHFEVS